MLKLYVERYTIWGGHSTKLQEMNDLYEISDVLPENIIIGSNGGGEFYGINSDGYYFNVPDIIEKEERCVYLA